MPKQIKVAMIPDDTRIIINIGSEETSEVYVGREIEVYIPGENVTDPDTNDIIGSYDLIKDQLEITNVYPTFSIARKVKEEKKSNFFSAISSPMLSEQTIITYKKINVNSEQNLNLQVENSTIQIGDYVKLI